MVRKYGKDIENEVDKRKYDYLGAHFKRSPSYAKKQFGVKEGAHTKLSTIYGYDSKGRKKVEKPSKESLAKAHAHMEKHKG